MAKEMTTHGIPGVGQNAVERLFQDNQQGHQNAQGGKVEARIEPLVSGNVLTQENDNSLSGG